MLCSIILSQHRQISSTFLTKRRYTLNAAYGLRVKERCTQPEKKKFLLLLLSKEQFSRSKQLRMYDIFTCSQKSCPPVQPGESFPVLQYVAYRHKLLVHIPSVCEADLQVNPEIQSMSVTTRAERKICGVTFNVELWLTILTPLFCIISSLYR
jgi:hypothetical protein